MDTQTQWDSAGTDVTLGRRGEEGGNRREPRADSSKRGWGGGTSGPTCTLEALEKDTVESHIPRDSKTVGWGEKEQKTKER